MSRGLSYYSDAAIGRHLKIDPLPLAAARQQLVRADLIAYRKPLYQVLSLPELAPKTPVPAGLAQRTSAIGGRHSSPGSGRRLPMIDYSLFCQLRQLHDQKHLTAAQIADELKLDAKTAALWIARPSYQPRQVAKRPSKLDAFKGQIVAQLERHPYTAQQLLQQLKTQGYAGGYSILKEFVRLVRPVRKPAYPDAGVCPRGMRPGRLGQFRFPARGFDPPAPELSLSWCSATAA